MQQSEGPLDMPLENFEEALLHLPYAYEVEVEVDLENKENKENRNETLYKKSY